jgi:hypothetical protein
LNKINSFADTNPKAGTYEDAVSDADFQEALKRLAAIQKGYK